MRAVLSRNRSMRSRASCRSRRDGSSAEPGAAASPSTILNRMRPSAARSASRSTGSGRRDRDRERRDERAEPPDEVSLRRRIRGEHRDDAVHLGHRRQGLEGRHLRPGLVEGADHDLVEQDRPLRVLGDPLGPDDRLGPVRLELEEVPVEADACQGEDADGRQERARGHGGPGIPVEPADAVRPGRRVAVSRVRRAPSPPSSSTSRAGSTVRVAPAVRRIPLALMTPSSISPLNPVRRSIAKAHAVVPAAATMPIPVPANVRPSAAARDRPAARSSSNRAMKWIEWSPSPTSIGMKTIVRMFRCPTVSVAKPRDQQSPRASVIVATAGRTRPLKKATNSAATPSTATTVATVMSRWAAPISSASMTARPVRPTSIPGYARRRSRMSARMPSTAAAKRLNSVALRCGSARTKSSR